jgi:hypothetical protein
VQLEGLPEEAWLPGSEPAGVSATVARVDQVLLASQHIQEGRALWAELEKEDGLDELVRRRFPHFHALVTGPPAETLPLVQSITRVPVQVVVAPGETSDEEAQVWRQQRDQLLQRLEEQEREQQSRIAQKEVRP